MEIDHHSHPHRLILKAPRVPYMCQGCKELGFGACFQCEHEICNFYLHEECARASPSPFHRFFNKCDFQFYEEKAPIGRIRICDACGKDVLGYNYQCLHKKAHDLHPCCLKLKHTLEGDGVKLHLKNNAKLKCLHCKSKEVSKGVKGWSYVSSCGNYCYHVACVKEKVYENWKKCYFSGNTDLSQITSLSIQSMVPNQNIVLGGNGSSSSRAAMYWKMAKSILKIIISGIFGDPISLITAVFEILRAD